MPNLTIIILSYNSAHIIGECLKSLNFDKYKVVVVDNASRDNSVEFVRKNFPKVEIIKIPKNIGYGRGNNVALEQVNTEFALVLNPDAIILEKDIEIVLEEMRKNPAVAMAGPVILGKYPLDQNEARSEIAKIEENFLASKNDYRAKLDDNFVARFLVGAALFMKVSIMKKIGFFDKEIFLYYEDNEICQRVEVNNYKNILVPNAFAFHIAGKSSGSSARVTYKKSWHQTWSKLHWMEKTHNSLVAKRAGLTLLARYFAKILLSSITLNKKRLAQNLGSFFGALSFLFGLKAFNKNAESRG
jgi:N-acetylglucosaminyl-diphospho-decaprenol L-rhamnosyltransferase